MLAIYLSAIETPEQRTLFEIVYYEYRDAMFAKARSILHDEHLAEDAVHTAFVRVADNFEKISDRLIPNENRADILLSKKIRKICPNVGGYLIIVVRNVCYSILQSDKRKGIVYTDNEEFIDSLPDGRDNMNGSGLEQMRNETAETIHRAIMQLPETYREALYMHVVLGMDAHEISEETGVNYETVRKRIQRGRSELQGIIERNGGV